MLIALLMIFPVYKDIYEGEKAIMKCICRYFWCKIRGVEAMRKIGDHSCTYVV